MRPKLGRIRGRLFYLLLQTPEQFGVKEVLYADFQTIAQLLDGRNRDAVVASADDVVHGGLRNAAHGAEFVDGQAALRAQFQNPFFDGGANRHGCHPSLKRAYPISLEKFNPFELK